MKVKEVTVKQRLDVRYWQTSLCYFLALSRESDIIKWGSELGGLCEPEVWKSCRSTVSNWCFFSDQLQVRARDQKTKRNKKMNVEKTVSECVCEE